MPVPISEIKKKCKKIKLLISDIDGVLTDGGMYYTENGEFMKKFNTRDGMVLKLLDQSIQTVFVTGEKSKITKPRARKINVNSIYEGITKKELILPIICKKYHLKPNEIAYIGDDVNDFDVMKRVGFCASPNDAIKKILEISDYVCTAKGGEGAFREFAEVILQAQT